MSGFIKVCPWFEGPAELLVRGFWFDERDRKFLALRVDGCSDPEGAPVGFLRSGGRDSSSGAAAGGNRIRYVTKRKNPDEVRLMDSVPPDRGSPIIRLEDPLFEVLGKPRVVEQVGKPDPRPPVRSRKGKGNGPTQHSASEEYSTDKEAGTVYLAARVDLRSGDVLSDMWKTLLRLQEKRSDVVSSVAWVALDQDSRFRHRQGSPPQLILLEPFTLEEEDGLPTGVRNWLWLDPEYLSLGRRGLLVMRCVVEGISVYFVEVERRPGRKENFSGMVFKLRPGAPLDNWLNEVRSGIRDVKGVFSKLCSKCPSTSAQ